MGTSLYVALGIASVILIVSIFMRNRVLNKEDEPIRIYDAEDTVVRRLKTRLVSKKEKSRGGDTDAGEGRDG